MSHKRRTEANEKRIPPAGTPVPADVVAAFTYDLTDQPTVHFFDVSVGPIIGRNWDFDDGSANVSVKNPSHTYNVQGVVNFLVRLTVNPGIDEVYIEQLISVANPNPGPAPLSLTDLSIDELTSLTIAALTDLKI